MQRAITGFHLDAASDWVAELVCGHRRHVRHEPPFRDRPWVTSAAGRAGRIGTTLDCVLCDRRVLPEGFAPYRRTPLFSEATLPTALLGAHTTKPGVWALIHVESGEVGYRVLGASPDDTVLRPGAAGVVPAEVEHHLALRGPVECWVEFWRAAPS